MSLEVSEFYLVHSFFSHSYQKTMGASDVPAVLSLSHLAFSDVVLFSVTRRVVFVTNTTDHTLSFNWELESSGVSEVSAN